MKLIFLFSIFFILGCQSTPVEDDNFVEPVITQKMYWYKDVTASDKSVFVSVDGLPGVPDILLKEAHGVKEKMKDWFVANGFNLVNKRAAASLWIDISIDFVEPFYLPKEDRTKIKFESSETKIETGPPLKKYEVKPDKEGRVYSYFVYGMSQSYGKRGQVAFYASAKSGMVSALAEKLRTESPQWLAEFNKIQVSEKLTTIKSKKSEMPGCLPRFGYEYVKKIDSEGEKIYIVHKVEKKSAAEKAGIKVGDQLLTIDSIPIGDFNITSSKTDEVYELQIEVPIKILRDGKEIRSKIKAQISCE